MMGEDSRGRLSAALLGALRPIASALLGCGVSYKDFAEICKRAFVEAALKKYGLRGRPTNVSRVAALTGLSRKEVARIRADSTSGRIVELTTRCAPGDVLNRWTTSAAYVSVQGDPISLPFESRGICFARLVREAAGDLPAGAIKFELSRAGCIVESANGELQIVRRHYVPADIGQRLVDGLHYGLRTMALTVEFNSDESNEGKPRFQRLVHRGRISPSDAENMRQALVEYLTVSSHAVDDYFSKYEPPLGADNEHIRVGVGLYYYEDQIEQ